MVWVWELKINPIISEKLSVASLLSVDQQSRDHQVGYPIDVFEEASVTCKRSKETRIRSELENDIEELKANYEISRIRRFAKIFLIGFFFGKNSEKRVAELSAKIQTRINENISEINKLTSEIEDSGLI